MNHEIEHSSDLASQEEYEKNTEIVNFPENTQVFRDLIGLIHSHEISPEIIKGIPRDNIRRVVVMGGSGDGKSAVLFQMGETLKANKELVGFEKIMYHLYDDQLTGEDDDTYEFNERFFNKIIEDEKRSPESFSLIEGPGIGDKYPKDRAVTAFEKIAEESVKSGNDTYFIIMAENYALELMSGFIRRDILSLKETPEEVIPRLNSLGIQPVGFEKGVSGGNQILRQFEKMGQKVHIDAIREEEDELIDAWKMENHEEYEAVMSHIFQLETDQAQEIQKVYEKFEIDFPQMERTAQRAASTRTERSRERAARTVARLLNKGVPLDRIYPVFNPIHVDTVSLYNSETASSDR